MAKHEEVHNDWTFLTNHAHVLMRLAADPNERMRDIADDVGITERAVQRIIAELEADGYLERVRNGRRNEYKIHKDMPLRHPIESHRKINDIIQLINSNK